MKMDHGSGDPATELLAKMADLDKFELFHNQVMVAIYVRPEKTAGGIVLPDSSRKEDLYQGKIGLLIKKGASAFEKDDRWFTGEEDFKIGDWLILRPSDSWSIGVNGVPCRILNDVDVRGRITAPDIVW